MVSNLRTVPKISQRYDSVLNAPICNFLEHPPAIAMFAAFARYKREGYRHSEFAPRILADNDIDVVMKVSSASHNSDVTDEYICEPVRS